MLLTLEQFNAAYGTRSADIKAALKLHLVEGHTITDAVRRTGASRSGVYKALRSHVTTHDREALTDTWMVTCPRHHAATLHGLITRQLGIWEVQDAQAAEQALAGRLGVPTVGTQPALAITAQPPAPRSHAPQGTRAPIPADRVYISPSGEMYGPDGRVLIP